MRKSILVDMDECGACHICEMVCSLTREGECNPAKSRIQVLRGEMLETVLLCQQCEVLYCASICPEEAIKRDKATGAVLVDEGLCSGCKKCIKVCPFQAISYNMESKKALICDHCGGNPQCVEWCPRDALHYVELNTSNAAEKIMGAEKVFCLLHKIKG